MAPQFKVGITESLLAQIVDELGCPRYAAVQFFMDRVEKLLNTPPNIKDGRWKTQYERMQLGPEIWVKRGYYPGTDIFFKISAVKKTDFMFDVDPNSA